MNRIEHALSFIPADERDTWVMMAFAVKSEMGDAGFDIWDSWSQSAHNYNQLAARSVWKSCRGSGVTIGTLFHEARQCGWRDEKTYTPPTQEQIQARQISAQERESKEALERIRLAQVASKKAEWILTQCKHEEHAYLDLKGFKEVKGLVWRPNDHSNLLCIPMRVGQRLVGLQMIDKTGVKKFLSGQITSKAEHCIDAGGTDFWAEGYGTGLSLRKCLAALKIKHRIHITFSAGNLKRMAHSGYVIADHDASGVGEQAAQATGLPYWMPPTVGWDLNDQHRAQGTFKTSQVLRRWMQELRDKRDAA